MVNNRLKSNILETIDNQLRMNNPKCTKKTLDRLINLGYSEEQSKEKIGAVLIEEMYDILKNKVLFNEERYERNLSFLPKYNGKMNEE
jgi:Holliday junction resolvasome RuvABC DNA-binding subunit